LSARGSTVSAALEADGSARLIRAFGRRLRRRRSLETLQTNATGQRGQERDEKIEKNGVDEHGHHASLAGHHDTLASGGKRQEDTGGEENE
jgi:hypothetical protein